MNPKWHAKMNVLASPISDAIHTNPIIFLLSGPNFVDLHEAPDPEMKKCY